MRLLEGGRRKWKTAINVKSSDGLDNKCSEIAGKITAVTKTHSCSDIIIDGIQTIGSFERYSTGG